LIAALRPDDVVLGGGNARKLKTLPEGCRLGENANAFLGGFRLWDQPETPRSTTASAQMDTDVQCVQFPVHQD
jgi:polyphosphate glucokinase